MYHRQLILRITDFKDFVDVYRTLKTSILELYDCLPLADSIIKVLYCCIENESPYTTGVLSCVLYRP